MEPIRKPPQHKVRMMSPLHSGKRDGDGSERTSIDRLSDVVDRLYTSEYRAARKFIHKRLRQKEMGSRAKKPPPVPENETLYYRILAFRNGKGGGSQASLPNSEPPPTRSRQANDRHSAPERQAIQPSRDHRRSPQSSSKRSPENSYRSQRTPERTPPRQRQEINIPYEPTSRPRSRKARKYEVQNSPSPSYSRREAKSPYDRTGSKSSFESVELPPLEDDEDNINPTPKPTKQDRIYHESPKKRYKNNPEPSKVRPRSQSVSSISDQMHEFQGSYTSSLQPGYAQIPEVVSASDQHLSYVCLGRSRSDPDLRNNKSDTDLQEPRDTNSSPNDLRKRIRKKRNQRSSNDLDLAQKVFLRRRVLAFVDKPVEPTTARDVYVEMGDEDRDSPKPRSSRSRHQDDLPPVRESTPNRADRPLTRGNSDLNRHRVVPPIRQDDDYRDSRQSTPNNRRHTPDDRNSRRNTPDNRDSQRNTPDNRDSRMNTPENRDSRRNTPDNNRDSRRNTPDNRSDRQNSRGSDGARASVLSPRTPRREDPSTSSRDEPVRREEPRDSNRGNPNGDYDEDDDPHNEDNDDDDYPDSPEPEIPRRTPKVREEDGRIAALDKLADYNLKTLAGQEAGDAPEIDDKIMKEVFSPEFQRDLDNFLKT